MSEGGGDKNQMIIWNYSDTKIHTNKELAKMAGVVGTGTVARFNKMMNSNDEELKKKLLQMK